MPPLSNKLFLFGLFRNCSAALTVLEMAIGMGLPPSTGVDDRDRFSSGMSSARICWTTCGLPSRDLILGVVAAVEDPVRGEEDLVRLCGCPSVGVRSEDGVAGCFMVDLSKLLNVLI